MLPSFSLQTSQALFLLIALSTIKILFQNQLWIIRLRYKPTEKKQKYFKHVHKFQDEKV